MGSQRQAFHNPDVRSSGKVEVFPPRKSALKLAAEIARQIGLPLTWPNIQTIRLAIESEAAYSDLPIGHAAALIASAAHEFTVVYPERYTFQTAALLRKSNIVNRFWFEDALWRHKEGYDKMLARLQQEAG